MMDWSDIQQLISTFDASEFNGYVSRLAQEAQTQTALMERIAVALEAIAKKPEARDYGA
jgi:hypothetical protein